MVSLRKVHEITKPDEVCYPVLNVLTKTGVVLGIGILIRTLHIGLVWTP